MCEKTDSEHRAHKPERTRFGGTESELAGLTTAGRHTGCGKYLKNCSFDAIRLVRKQCKVIGNR
ncbi:MAG: hypothetical protein WC132_04105 [Methanomethylophilus sp.]